MSDIIKCFACGTSRDISKELNCKKCMDQFVSRTPPDRMLHRERIREAEFIAKHLLRADLPYELKWRRLEELSGRQIGDGGLAKDVVKEIIKQDKYPGMPKHLLKKKQAQTESINNSSSTDEDIEEGEPFDDSQLGWTNVSVSFPDIPITFITDFKGDYILKIL